MVDPSQFLGLEVNPRAAAIAELVLWIGYLQWHFRTRGHINPPEPVIKNFRNIGCRNAVLAWDKEEPMLDDRGQPVTRWDGRTMKKHPVTGELVPDESAQIPAVRYINPRKALWPEADFVVGNPPFIGNKRMRFVLGDGYVETLRNIYGDVPENVDYVMYWWDYAARLTDSRSVRRFGFITTNSITQTFNRQILQRYLKGNNGLSLIFAIPNHPWVDSADGADVRIAMTVADFSIQVGTLLRVCDEETSADIERRVRLRSERGVIHADLSIGAKVSGATGLEANGNLSFMGVTLVGEFRVDPKQIQQLGFDPQNPPPVIKPYVNGREISQTRQNRSVIDLYGLSKEDFNQSYPTIYQWLLERVKPLRDQNNRQAYKERWWIFGEPRSAMRKALKGLERYIVTLETSKHRAFTFLPCHVVPDHTLFVIASDDAFYLGVLSSKIHVTWALAAGSRLGVGNDPRWRNVTCFVPFPFPDANADQKSRIRNLAESLDDHRKRQQEKHSSLTMTDMYNVLEKLRSGKPLTEKEKITNEQGLISVLRQIHDDLDAAVSDAYGWPTSLTDEEILERLVALNTERVAEERRGIIRWLRPEYQKREEMTQTGVDFDDQTAVAAIDSKKKKSNWPPTLPEQARAVQAALVKLAAPATPEDVAQCFMRARIDRVNELLDTLVSLGQSFQLDDGRFVAQ
jgi:hypothetical protein